MCGIVGIVKFDNSPIDPEKLTSATNLMVNRGPDDSGIWIEGGLGLGHRRLSIIDLTETGTQPMHFENERFVIVHNGEVYNFKKIRDDLKNYGYSFSGTSDTEVILAAYSRWKTKCVNYFDGMFAFAIWDKKDKLLFIARDRMGVKPLFYTLTENQFIFSSRPSGIFQLLDQKNLELDYQSLRYYFDIGYIPAPKSIYKNVHKLEPAHWLLIKDGNTRLQRYWDFRNIETEVNWNKRPKEDLLDELDELITRGIESRMVSDVPLGAFLSGGIDSSLVVAAMAKKSNNPIKTFTIGFNDKEHDESEFAAQVGNHLKTDHYCEHLNVDELIDLLPNLYKECDEPFFDSSIFPTMAVSRLAKKYVTVSLSGDGGDELFGGYHYYNILKKIKPFYEIPSQLRRLIAFGIGKLPKHQFKILSAALKTSTPSEAFAFSRSITKDFGMFLSSDIVEQTKGIGDVFYNSSLSMPSNLHPSEESMRLDAQFTLSDDYLQKVDIASMAFSLESREPLLSTEVIEWAMKLPLKWKLKNGTNKYLLRELAYRYIPKSILDRPKQGFGVPVEHWLRGPMKNWAEERLMDKKIIQELPFDHEKIIKLWNLHQSGARNVYPLLWSLIMFMEFYHLKFKIEPVLA